MKPVLALLTALCLLCAALPPGRAAAPGTAGGNPEISLTPEPGETDERTALPVIAAGFTDVPAELEAAVSYVIDHNLMTEFQPGTFAPDKTISRADAVEVLYNLAGRPAAKTPHFPDVRTDWWYTDPIGWASAAGLISGYADGRFGPMERITREQLACVLYAYQRSCGYELRYADLTNCSDASAVNRLANTAMAWAVGGKVLQLKDGAVRPKDNASRGDIALAMLALTRGQNRIQRPESITSAYAAPYDDGVNLRAGPGTGYEVITFCPPSWHLTVLERQDPWIFVRTPTGETGYIWKWNAGLHEETWTMPVIQAAAVPVSPEEAAAKLESLMETYPDGSYWNNPDRSVSYKSFVNNMDGLVSSKACSHDDSDQTCCYHMGICTVPFAHPAATQCLGYVSLLSDLIFGAGAPMRAHKDLDAVQVGDIIRFIGNSHAVLVTGIAEKGVYVTECNRDFQTCKIHWGRLCTWRELKAGDISIVTRYPDPDSDGSSQVLAASAEVPVYAAPGDGTPQSTLWRGEFVYAICRQPDGWYLIAREGGEKGYVQAEQLINIYQAT